LSGRLSSQNGKLIVGKEHLANDYRTLMAAFNLLNSREWLTIIRSLAVKRISKMAACVVSAMHEGALTAIVRGKYEYCVTLPFNGARY